LIPLLSSSKKISYLPPVWGVILVRVSFEKIFYQAQNGIANDIFPVL
jgi:hypothetical protein